MLKDAIAEKGEITMKDFFDIRNEQKLKDMEIKMEIKMEKFVQNIMKNVNCSSIDEACKLMGCSLQEYYAAKAFLAKK